MNELTKNYLTPSKLSKFLLPSKKPFIKRYVFGHRPPESPAAEKGKLLHLRIKELIESPSKFKYLEKFILKPQDMRRGTKAYAAFLEENKGREIVTQEEIDTLEEIALEIETTPELVALSDSVAQSMLKVKKTEEHPNLGLAKSGKIVEFEVELFDDKNSITGFVDIVDHKNSTFYEIKSTSKPANFFTRFQEADVLYQCLIYKHLLQENYQFTDREWNWKWILISTVFPFEITIFDAQDVKEDVAIADRALRADIARYKEFYTNLCDLLRRDPIIQRPPEVTREYKKMVYQKLKTSKYFKKYFTGSKLEFNNFAMQKLADRGL